MTTTIDEILEDVRQGTTPGQRLTRSETYLRAAGELVDELPGHNFQVLSGPEFRDQQRAAKTELAKRVDLSAFAQAGPTVPTSERLPAPVAALIPVEPTEAGNVRTVDIEVTEPAGTLGDKGSDPATDASAREFDATATGSRTTLNRWQVAARVSENVLEDAASARRYIDRLSHEVVSRVLADEALNGDGSTTSGRVRLLGVLNRSGLQTHARDTANSEARIAALAEAVRLIGNAGHTGRVLTAVATPDTLKALRMEVGGNGTYLATALGAVVPDIRQWVPSTFVPAGTVLVGDWAASTLYLRNSGWTLKFRASHSDDFLKGWLASRLATSLHFDVEYEDAFCSVTDMG